jgi:hypothetical protein
MAEQARQPSISGRCSVFSSSHPRQPTQLEVGLLQLVDRSRTGLSSLNLSSAWPGGGGGEPPGSPGSSSPVRRRAQGVGTHSIVANEQRPAAAPVLPLVE